MRPVPMMQVEVDGAIVRRPGELDVRQYDQAGRPIVVRMRVQLQPGERLIERLGKIPKIVKELEVADVNDVFRHQMVRAVLGTQPAMLSKEADPVAITSLCRQLVDAQDAKALLRANGCGRHTDSLAAMVRTLLEGRADVCTKASRAEHAEVRTASV